MKWQYAVVVPALLRVALAAVVGGLTALLADAALPEGCGQAVADLLRKLFGL